MDFAFLSSLTKVAVYVLLARCPTSSGVAPLLVSPLPTTEFYFFLSPCIEPWSIQMPSLQHILHLPGYLAFSSTPNNHS